MDVACWGSIEDQEGLNAVGEGNGEVLLGARTT